MKGIILIHWHEFIKTPIHEFEKPLEEKFVAMKVITGYEYDNTTLLIGNTYGDWFSTHIERTHAKIGSIAHKAFKEKFGERVDLWKIFQIYIWDYKGQTIIYHTHFVIEDYIKPIPRQILEEVEKELNAYTEGLIRCSDCGTQIPRSSIAGRYFAGVYCTRCWEGTTGTHKDKGGWKVVEARETYE